MTDAIPAVREAPDTPRGPYLAALIAGQVLAVITLIIWAVVAVVTVIAAATEGSVGAWIFVGLVLLYPLWPIGFSVAAWRSWGRGRWTWAVALMILAFAPAVILAVIMTLSAV